MTRVLAFGEILWDIIDGKYHLGGAPLNFAAHVSQGGLYAGILSCIGIDKIGDDALSAVEKIGLDTSLILRRNKRTGIVKVNTTNGQPDYDIIENVAFDYIDVGRLEHDKIATYDIFYFGTLIQRHISSRESLHEIFDRHTFKQVFYDVNLRKNCFNREHIEYSMGHCTMLKVNDEEVAVIGELLGFGKQDASGFGQEITSRYPNIQTVIVTAGGEGCYIFANKSLTHIPSSPVKVADTVGAGDSFSAAFVVVYSQTGDVVKAATIANKVGGFVASQHGPIPAYTDEIKTLFK